VFRVSERRKTVRLEKALGLLGSPALATSFWSACAVEPRARCGATAQDISSPAREGLRRAALDSLKRLIERHLDSPQLSVDFICARSGWSRATVYRLFESEGGLAHYIRQRHLLTALRELVSGQQPHRRILDLALSHQFSSEAAFNRAFRRAFGVPPGKIRDLAARSRAAAPDESPVATRGKSLPRSRTAAPLAHAP
jgi:AraC-like DNA-binding protein